MKNKFASSAMPSPVRNLSLNKLFWKAALLLLVFSFPFQTSAQERLGLSLDRNNVLVGDLVKIKIDIQLPPGATIKEFDLAFGGAMLIPAQASPTPGQMTPVPEDDRKPDFEWRSLGKWPALPDSSYVLRPPALIWDTLSSGNTTILSNTIEIISWDAGIIKFPPMVLLFQENGGARRIVSNNIELKVNAPQAPAPTSQVDSLGLAPIKDIRMEPFKAQDMLPYLLGLLLLGMLAAVVWVFMRKKKLVVPPPAPTRWLPVDELATAQLNSLQKKQLWQQGQVKEYHSELTHIVREYLEHRYHIQALESPTSEILRQMKPLGFSQEYKSQLQEMLQMADMVKFAKAQPEVTIHDQLMAKARDFILKTKPTQLLDDVEDGWVEVPIDEDQENPAYALVRDKTIRKRILENAHDFIKFEEAPLGRRALAFLIDSVLLGLIGGVIVMALYLLLTNNLGVNPILLPIIFMTLMIVIVWIFFVEIEVRSGATPGKRMLSLQIMDARQDNISRVEALMRWIMKFIAVALFPFFIGYALLKKSRILLHDDMTDTRVYYVKK